MKRFLFIVMLICKTQHLCSQIDVGFPQVCSFAELEIAQKEIKKPIVVYVYTDWCKYCYAMKKNTFGNAKVMQMLNENYYFVMLNAESKKSIRYKNHDFHFKQRTSSSGIHELAEALASKKGRVTYPTTVILNTKGEIEEQIDSFLSSDALLQMLQLYLDFQKKKKG